MTNPDYRALCAELVDIITAHANPDDAAVGYVAGVIARARALPAVPDGREPASVALQPSDGELWTMYDDMRGEPGDWAWVRDLVRAVLDRWGRQPARLRNCPTHGQQPPEAWGCPECVRELREELAASRHPTPAAEGEVAEVAAWLRLFCSEEYESRYLDPDVAWLTRAAELLEQRHPAPPGEERIGNWLLPEKPPLPEHWSGDLEYGFETAWETARALLQQRYPTPAPVSELPQGWHMLSDIEPEPGAMCDWVIMAPWGCDHGSGQWPDHNGVPPCEFFDVPVGWPVCYKGFASADGVMVSDPKLTAWRMLSLPTSETIKD